MKLLSLGGAALMHFVHWKVIFAAIAVLGFAPWRWASSPAAVWVYSAIPQTVTLRATPIALHDPASADGKGPAGQFAVSLNGRDAGEWQASAGQPMAIPLTLVAGWNEVALDLAAGNFKPIDVQPETGDSRSLSFALQGLAVGSAVGAAVGSAGGP